MFDRLRRFGGRVKSFLGSSIGKMRYVMSQGTPGAWAADHAEQSQHFTGWNYIAIHAKAMQAMQSKVEVFQDDESPEYDPESQPLGYESEKSLSRLKHLRAREEYEAGRRAGGYGHLLKLKGYFGLDEADLMAVETSNDLYRILKRPNPSQSGGSIRYEWFQQMGLTGTALTVIINNQLGWPLELYSIPTCMATPIKPSLDYPRGGWHISSLLKFWDLTDPEGYQQSIGPANLGGAFVPAEDMMVFRFPHPIHKDDGYSPLEGGALSIDVAEQLDRSRWYKFMNMIDSSLVLVAPEDVDPDSSEMDEVRQIIKRKSGGSANAGAVLTLPYGSEVKDISTSPREMDYVGGHPQLRDVILGLHQVPPVAAGIQEGGSYASFYASLKQFTTLSVQPLLDLIAGELTEQLAPRFDSALLVKLYAAGIDDPELLERMLNTDKNAGVITVGEWRQIRGLPLLGDERDDKLVGGGNGGGHAEFGLEDEDDDDEPFPMEKVGESDETTTGRSSGPRPSSNGNGNGKAKSIERYSVGGRLGWKHYPAPDYNGAPVTGVLKS